MNPGAQKNLARAAGALLGVGLAAALLLVSLPGAAGSPAPASVRVVVDPVGELEIDPAAARPVLAARGLKPGGPPASGSFLLRNQTGTNLAVALRAKADSTALNGLLRVTVRVGGRPAATTTLEGLQLHPIRLRLVSGQRVRVRLEAWLSSEVLSGYEGARVTVSLDPGVRTLGESG
jgi:hypothetical protein